MAAVDAVAGSVDSQEIRTYGELSAGLTPFESGDVLVAKITPCFENGKIAQARTQTRISFGSTEFHVVRARPAVADQRYIFHFLRQGWIRRAGERRMTGSAGQRRVPEAFLRTISIPMPPVEEQQRIAAILDAADELRAKRRGSLRLLDTLTESMFLDMFGDQHASWPIVPTASLAADEAHAIRTGPFGSQLLHSEFVDDGVAVLGIDNAVQDRFAWGRPRFITEEKFSQLRRYQVKPGDVLVTIMATCGRVAIVPDNIPPAINTKHLCCITLDRTRCLPSYLWAAFRFHPGLRRQLGANARGAVMPGLNMGLIKGATLPLPPIEMQANFGQCLGKLENVATRQAEHDRQLNVLFASLQHRAFRGEL
jgi:type I restriction enzyme, S subunit